MLEDNTCHFLAVDFDEAEWRADAGAFFQSCSELKIPAAIEISRSGQGAHVWIFFSVAVPARDARRLGTALISHTCSRTRQLKLESYDRLFPNQDTMPKGGFGNLIALPLQKKPRESGFSVFVDADLRPYPDQWGFLATITVMPSHDIEPTVLRAAGDVHPLDVSFIDEEDHKTPWKPRSQPVMKLTGDMPVTLTVRLANQVFFEKSQLPQALANRLIRLAVFPNPEFYKAQAMRFPVWNKPRLISCAQNHPHHIALPRGCFDAACGLLANNGIGIDLRDERLAGEPIDVTFLGTLRPEQEAAVATMLKHDAGVLCAPTAFGKTVTAAAIIARRAVNTLILVHRIELLKQWQERLSAFVNVGKNGIGVIGGGKNKLTGGIDIAVMQSLSRHNAIEKLIENYGQIIVDECHHIGAVSFEAILLRAKAKFILGLTATPIRRDGLHPIIFMQCGSIKYKGSHSAQTIRDLTVAPVFIESPIDLPPDAGIQDVFKHLAQDPARTASIARTIIDAYHQGHKVLVLTERTEHIQAIHDALTHEISDLFVLHGRISKKQRTTLISELNALPPDAPRVLLATGKLVGEGFDHPPLDTLVLAMPISWKGTLQQYAGRLHREHPNKSSVKIIDFIDTGHRVLSRMWNKRKSGYLTMGYRIETSHSHSQDQPTLLLPVP